VSHFLFVDESGIDQRDSPYEVLAGVVIRDRELWDLIQEIGVAEVFHFGQRISAGALELKAKKLLKKKTFRLAGQMSRFGEDRRRGLSSSCLEKGRLHEPPTRQELTALAQSKIAFVKRVLTLCGHFGVRAFASIVPKSAPRPSSDFLRKDYAYLFERFYYFLEEHAGDERGIVVFDELERSRCHVLHDQMSLYFKETGTGRMRSSLIVPEPFFVHSELTSAVQLADLVAYILSWGVRFGPMTEPARDELEPFANLVCDIRYRTTRSDRDGDEWTVWSFKYIDDLRPEEERS
jgi:hypothetical protein